MRIEHSDGCTGNRNNVSCKDGLMSLNNTGTRSSIYSRELSLTDVSLNRNIAIRVLVYSLKIKLIVNGLVVHV